MAAILKSEAPTYAIESVDSALRVLRMLCGGKELRVSQVADQLNVAPSTAHRILSMLVHHGFARQDVKRGGYRQGPQILQMGFAAIRDLDVRHFARPILEEVRAQIDETVHLAVPYGREVFYVEGIESQHRVRIGLRVGEFLPANCVGVGKALLATLTKEQLHKLFPLQDLPSLTSNSISNRDELERHLDEVRQLGFARSRAESDDDVGSVAVAVLDDQNIGRAAITVSAPLIRITPEREEIWIQSIREAAVKLRARMWGGREAV